MRNVPREKLLAAEVHLGRGPVRDRGRAVVLFPNSYEVGMSSLALHTLYSLLNAGGVVCERAFAPPGGPAEEVRSLESDTPLAGFDFILLTSSYELDWLRVPALLSAGGLPPLREDRGEEHPILLAGGPAVTMNPEPLADLYDLALIGELEPVAAQFLAALRESDTREEVFSRLEALPGVYSPTRPEHAPELGARRGRVTRLVAPDLAGLSTESALLTPHTVFADRFLIEIGRGCGRGCGFCLARRIYHPNRARKPAALLERVEAALPHTRRVGLVGAAVSDYPWGEELFSGLRELGAEVSVSSVRAESVSDGMLAVLGASGHETLTLAPEAGAVPLRAAVGKETSDAQFADVLRRAVAFGIPRFKLYFMVGLPGETEEDVEQVPELVARLHQAAPEALLSVSVSPFVPKPHTPLEREPLAPEATLDRRMKLVERGLQRAGIHDLDQGSARWASAQGVLSRGGRELGRALVEAARAGGSLSDLKAAVALHGRSWQEYLGPLPAAGGEAPWQVVAC